MSTNKHIADIQALSDNRNLALNWVGIKSLKHPAKVADLDDSGQPYETHGTAHFNLYVNLPAHCKGTHMSRFIEMLNEKPIVLSVRTIPEIMDAMLSRLEAQKASLEAQFDFFLEKQAPISKIKSLLDYKVTLKGRVEQSMIQTGLELIVPVATVCPCSKEISDYGAHNQRSHVTLKGWLHEPVSLTSLIRLIEKQASCDLYGTLKRIDEKWVTEQAYNNPKFVEDLVRDIAVELNQLNVFSAYSVSSENFESIHNHSAYAEIAFP